MVHYSTSKFVTRKDSEIPDLTLLSSVQDHMKSSYLCFIEYGSLSGNFIFCTLNNPHHFWENEEGILGQKKKRVVSGEIFVQQWIWKQTESLTILVFLKVGLLQGQFHRTGCVVACVNLMLGQLYTRFHCSAKILSQSYSDHVFEPKLECVVQFKRA